MFAVLFSIRPCCDDNSTYKYRKSSIKPPPLFRGGKLIIPLPPLSTTDCVIIVTVMPVILMFYKVLILQGEI